MSGPIDTVWIVTRWNWGGGGDDSTEIVGVYRTAEEAYAAAKGEDQVAGYPVPFNRATTPSGLIR